jgi:hypothetical protein
MSSISVNENLRKHGNAAKPAKPSIERLITDTLKAQQEAIVDLSKRLAAVEKRK